MFFISYKNAFNVIFICPTFYFEWQRFKILILRTKIDVLGLLIE